MPLELLGPLVVVGIAVVVLIVRFVANTPPRLIEDESTATTVLLQDFPEAEPSGSIVLSASKSDALIELVSGDHIGLVHNLGSKHVTRLLSAADIGSVSSNEDTGLDLKLNEFTLPIIRLQFETSRERNTAVKMIENISNSKTNLKTE